MYEFDPKKQNKYVQKLDVNCVAFQGDAMSSIQNTTFWLKAVFFAVSVLAVVAIVMIWWCLKGWCECTCCACCKCCCYQDQKIKYNQKTLQAYT